jgi:hypothetical protein
MLKTIEDGRVITDVVEVDEDGEVVIGEEDEGRSSCEAVDAKQDDTTVESDESEGDVKQDTVVEESDEDDPPPPPPTRRMVTGDEEVIKRVLPPEYLIVFQSLGIVPEEQRSGEVQSEVVEEEVVEDDLPPAGALPPEDDILRVASPLEQMKTKVQNDRIMLFTGIEKKLGLSGLATEINDDPIFQQACEEQAKKEIIPDQHPTGSILDIKRTDTPSTKIWKRAATAVLNRVQNSILNGTPMEGPMGNFVRLIQPLIGGGVQEEKSVQQAMPVRQFLTDDDLRLPPPNKA